MLKTSWARVPPTMEPLLRGISQAPDPNDTDELVQTWLEEDLVSSGLLADHFRLVPQVRKDFAALVPRAVEKLDNHRGMKCEYVQTPSVGDLT